MWYTWTTLLLVLCALGEAAEVSSGTETPAPVATTRAPPRTLDRQAAELAWRIWLQSPESGNQNAPPRRITTKSLFITPLVCPKGQRLDRNGCVQVVTVNKDEHERILLEQLNALFTSAPSGDVLYDYGEEEPGPLQLSIPIGLDPQAAPLQAEEPSAQAHELQPNYVKIDKKDDNKPNADGSIEAELELLKLPHSRNPLNETASSDGTGVLNHNVLNNFLPFPEKPKRDTPLVNDTEAESPNNSTNEGQKELVYGHVNVDPVIYDTDFQQQQVIKIPTIIGTEIKLSEIPPVQNNATLMNNTTDKHNDTTITFSHTSNKTKSEITSNLTAQVLQPNSEQAKLNPENDYSDIGEAIKLISRYAEVTTDDNFAKDQKKYATKEDNILGTRTRLQHRHNKPKPAEITKESLHVSSQISNKDNPPGHSLYPKNEVYYRYPWPSQHSPTPPPDYPFRHLQDYWPGRNQIGGVYNTHENPRRHHHSYPHNYFRPHGYPNAYVNYPRQLSTMQEIYPEQFQGYQHRLVQRRANSVRSHNSDQDLYSLLGLRHWFSSEETSKR